MKFFIHINIFCVYIYIYIYSFAINDVQDKNEYFWRYQRYQLIREYFEKPKFAFPPLSLIVYIFMLINLIWRRRTSFRVFSKYSDLYFEIGNENLFKLQFVSYI